METGLVEPVMVATEDSERIKHIEAAMETGLVEPVMVAGAAAKIMRRQEAAMETGLVEPVMVESANPTGSRPAKLQWRPAWLSR